MTGNLPADVTVWVHHTAECKRVEFKARNGTQPFRATLTRQRALDEVREALDVGLLRLKEILPPLVDSDSKVVGPDSESDRLNRAFDALYRLGCRLFFILFGSQEDVINGLEDFWNDALPFGRNPRLPPPLVECIGDKDAFLPLEYLPLFSMTPPSVITCRDDFVKACRSLVGFSCMVRRAMLPAPQRGGIELQSTSDDLLPMRYLYFEHLKGAQEELKWLSSAAAHRVQIEGPYPNSAGGVPSLSLQIFDPTLLLTGNHRNLPDQIQHFACHCYTAMTSPLDNEIQLSGGGHELQLTLGTISEDLVALGARAKRNFELPLVVMNACGSARMQSASALSFPDLFLQNGNRGFVGSDIEVPDDVAAAFSKALYERFLLYRLPLGRSLLGARDHLLNRFGNPLGIVYSSYADPQLHVRPFIEEESHGAAD
ncbi:CHAT domain-containing protein [Streptomyces sp. NBC_01006]|uniref:CHAT domain-containing protein n=1 Tax=Streptomyces sp. NBC_01006 TaxID=2903716 RepID=UPI002F90F08C|nr:CHAT domain-containing protein [Streptomyces sp. NBC_01006]